MWADSGKGTQMQGDGYQVTSTETPAPPMIEGLFNSNIPCPLGLHHLATSVHALSYKARAS